MLSFAQHLFTFRSMHKLILAFGIFCTITALSAFGQKANLQTFVAKEGKKFEAVGLPGGSFKILDHVPTARSSSGIVEFPNATVGKTGHCTVRVHVEEGVETGREVSVEGKKNAQKFYEKTLKEEFGTPGKLIEVNGVYMYQWKNEPVGEKDQARLEYHWTESKKTGTMHTVLISNPIEGNAPR